jgi:polypyrimidine tract-binding protein 2
MLKHKNQALVEFTDLLNAQNFMEEYVDYLPTIHDIVVYPSYSQYPHLTATNEPPISLTREESPPSPVLLVTILNPLYPITVDILTQIFNPYDKASGFFNFLFMDIVCF